MLLWPVGVLTGDDDEPEPAAEQAASGSGDGQNAAQQGTGAPAGIAIVVEQNGGRQLLVQAARLEPSGQREAYEVWLYNSQGDAKTLGGQVTDQQGNYQAIGTLPSDFEQYRFIDISREPLDQQRGHSGDSVLRGRAEAARGAAPGRSGGRRAGPERAWRAASSPEARPRPCQAPRPAVCAAAWWPPRSLASRS